MKYGASSDQTNLDLGVQCSRLEKPLVGMGVRSTSTWAKIAQIIEESLP